MRLVAACLAWLAAAPLCAQVITEASYSEPTTRYAHGVLGDDEEWGNMSVVVRTERGKKGDLLHSWVNKTYNLRLPDELVFEDVAPRLVDLDGEHGPEIVVVESHRDKGARLAVYGINDAGVPALRAWTNFIGTRNRWLAPVGAADFDGNGVMDLAFVDRPHLARRLIVVPYQDGFLDGLIVGMDGVSNHRIGDDYISGGIRTCGNGPEMIVLTGDWSKIIAVSWDGDTFHWQQLAPNKGPDSIAAVMECR